MLDMYINHAGCVILQLSTITDFRKKLTTTSVISIVGYNHIWAKEESNSLQKSKYVTTFYRNASQRKINFAVTPSK